MRRTVLVSSALVSSVTAGLSGALTAILLAGCGGGPGGGGLSGSGFAEVLAAPAPTADYAWYPDTVTEALPSVEHPDGMHASELAATGRFTGWERGARSDEGIDTIDLRFEVDEVVDALGDLTVLEGGTVTVHVGADGSADLDRVADELLALDDVVLFLNHVGPEPWPPPEWVIVFGNAFLGDVQDDGAITWPVTEAIETNNPADAHPEVDVRTLDELKSAAP